MVQPITVGGGTHRTIPYPGGTPSVPQTPSSGGVTPATSVNVPVSNGGVFAQTQIAIFPCFNVPSNRTEYHAFDVTQGFNDPYAASDYSWRVEQPGAQQGSTGIFRQATVRRIILTFRDLGQVTATFTITGANDNQDVVSQSTSLGFGSKAPTLRLFTIPINFQITCLLPQLSVHRDANAGPLSIVQVVMVGEVEEVTL